MKKYFGTDGVRGEYGKLLTDNLARKLGYYGTKVLTESHKPVIIIGRDTRESGPALEQALAQGIKQAGGVVLSAGIIPTPAMAVLIKELNADAAIMISASHNPYQDNGIKFFNSEGFKLADEIEAQIEELINTRDDQLDETFIELEHIQSADRIYLDFIKNSVDLSNLKNKKIVIDCANGANYKIAPEFFSELTPELIVIGDQPDGKNINLNSGSTSLDHLAHVVTSNDADFGLAFDGDADRLLAVDNAGNELNGDKILYLIGQKLLASNNLKENTIVATTMSNLGLEEALTDSGIKLIRQDVGDRYVLKEMLENDYNLGGEQSGHIILLDKQTTGDGLLTAAVLSEILSDSELTAEELNNLVPTYPQVIYNADVDDNKKFTYTDYPSIVEEIQKIEKQFEGRGRVNIRPSGTQPLVRVMIEGKDKEEVQEAAKRLVTLIEEELNAD